MYENGRVVKQISAGASSSNTPAAVRLMSRRVVVDSVISSSGPQKLGLNGLGCLPFKTSEPEQELLRALFERVVLPSDGLFTKVDCSRACHLLNRRFLRVFGMPGVVFRSLNGKNACGGNFYYLALTPELFCAEERKPVPGEHFKLPDVLSLRAARFIQRVAANNYSQLNPLCELLGVSPSSFYPIMEDVAAACRAFGLPKAIGIQHKQPRLYFVREEFALFFGLKTTSRLSMDVFSQQQQEAVRFLAEHPGSSHSDLVEHFGFSRKKAREVLLGIHQRAALFGFVAFRHHKNKKFCFSLSKEFAAAVSVKVSEAKALSTYFSSKQEELLLFFARHPQSSVAEAGSFLAVSYAGVSRAMRHIQKRCNKHNLPRPLERARKWGSKYSLTPEFANSFNIPIGTPGVASLFPPRKRKVYVFFKNNPHATTLEAARAVYPNNATKPHPTQSVITHHVRGINKTLRAHGLEPITYGKRGDKYRRFDSVAEYFAAYRRKHGKWPTASALSKAGEDAILQRVSKKFGGMHTACARAWGALSPEERLQFTQADRRKLNGTTFKKFNGEEAKARLAVLGAFNSGADVPTLLRAVRQCDDASSLKESLSAFHLSESESHVHPNHRERRAHP